MKRIILLALLFFGGKAALAQTKQAPEVPSPIIYIYDASGSMWGQLQGKTKMEIASSVLSTSIDDFAENQKIGLVAYGHRKKGDCRDVETLLPITNTSKSKVASAVKEIKPLGKTPLAYSAETVIGQLRSSKQKATIVLITDGIESCDGDICKVVSAAKKEGIDFKLHIVGFGLKEGETEQLKCAAKAGDGNYYDAADASGLSEAMTDVAAQTVDKPKGNLGVFVIKDGKALDANVEAFPAGKKNRADFGRTYKDTTYLYLPQGTYDLKVWQHSINVITPVTIKGVQTLEDKTTYKTISLDGAKITALVNNNGKLYDGQVSIFNLEGKRVFGGRTYGKPKSFELDAGTYHIEIQARNVHGLENKHVIQNVAVGNGEVTEVSHNFKTGVAILGATFNGAPFDAGIRIVEESTGEQVYAFRTRKRNLELVMNPGTYKVTFSEPNVYNSSGMSGTMTIVVKEGETITKTTEMK